MEHDAGLAVSLELTSACIVGTLGTIVSEVKVGSDPEVLIGFLCSQQCKIGRVGLEAGPLSQWLHAGLIEAGFEAVLLETRHVKASLSAMSMKTDRGMPAALPSCFGLAGTGMCTRSRWAPRRCGHY